MRYQISKKQENCGKRDILSLVHQLSQTLKVFEGIYTRKLEHTDGLTVETWMSAHGVERTITKSGKKKGYTPAAIRAGWHDCMQENGACKIFKGVNAKVMIDNPTEENPVSYLVYTKEQAESEHPQAIKRYMLCPIAEDRWSVETILKGLMQTNNFENENAKQIESDLAWEQLEHVYIIKEVKNEETGEITKKIVEVEKAKVVF